MTSVVLWVLLALLQATGPTGQAFGNPEDCEEIRADLSQDPSTIAVSECIPVTLTKPGVKVQQPVQPQ